MNRFVLFVVLMMVLPAFAVKPDDVTRTETGINIAASSDNTVITAVPGKHGVVYKIWLVDARNAAVHLTFQTGASTSFNVFAVPLTAQGLSITYPPDRKPCRTPATLHAFLINLSGAQQVTGRIYYALR